VIARPGFAARAAAVLLLAGVLAAPVRAATWWRLPIWGAEVHVFALDPFTPGSLYCGTSRGNFYGSTDGGASWAPLRTGPAFPGYVVTSLIADSRTPGRLWASLAGQYKGGLVVRSDNRGSDWTILATWKETVATRALAVVSGDPAILAVGGDDGVRLSRDGGNTWRNTGNDTPGLAQVESLAFDPADPRILYAGTWRQAFRTRDDGATWARIAEGMVLDATVYSWDFAAADPRDIWVSTCGWVYRTRDGGDKWTRFKNGFTNRRSHAVRRDPTRPGVVYAATVGGLHRSTDGGETWSRISRESLVVTALDVDRTTGRLFVGTEGEGIFYSDDGGATLTNGSVGLTEGRVSDLVPDPNDPGRLFFFRAYGGDESGVWEARGLRVRRVSRDILPPAAALTAFRDPAGKTVLGLASSSGLRFSRDLGEHWIAPPNPPAGTAIALFGAPFAHPVLITTAGAFRIGGAGEEFTSLGGPAAPTAAELLSDSSGGPILEVRSGEGLSRWNGQAWSSHRAGLLKGGIFVEEKAPVASYSSLSEVGGKLIWEEGGRKVSVSSPRAGLALATAAPAPGGRLYVGTTGDGLFLFEP
jgi:ligand-binding sensor domain-containing protein